MFTLIIIILSIQLFLFYIIKFYHLTVLVRIPTIQYTITKERTMMKTTLNIDADILKKINLAAYMRGISRTDIIVILMKMVMNDVKNPDCFGSLVCYQVRRSPDVWHTYHIKWKPDVYEYCLDLRKLLKMSVSLILAYAVKKYLKRLLEKNAGDNNHFHNYILAKNIIDGTIVWKLIWGLPPNLDKFLIFD
jgi:hypothetical protein